MESSKPLADVFTHCPACGGLIQSPGANPLKCQHKDCGFTYYFGPVTAVGAIVSDDEGHVLFIRRANDPGKGKLGLPGGFVDAGETLETAVAREVKEETNLDLSQCQYLTSGPNRYVYKGTEIAVTDMFFSCRVHSFESLNATDGEASDFLLVTPTPDSISQMAFASNQTAVREWLRSR